jgi:deazaflavin-dependent oxidoreductase (nitroreductase family)
MTQQDVKDSPTGWVKEHIDAYVATGGDEGHLWRGVPTLLLTTVGRRSGERRRTALIYGRDGDDYVVVASYGGAPKHPAWYLNLVDRPEVEVQVGDEVFPATARVADPQARARLWPELARIWPAYDEYQGRTDREIPLVVLHRTEARG